MKAGFMGNNRPVLDACPVKKQPPPHEASVINYCYLYGDLMKTEPILSRHQMQMSLLGCLYFT